jgi:hypothetical protein
MGRLLLFESFSNKEVVYDNIKISYEGDSDSLFLIYYTGYDDFLSHDIVAKVESIDDGVKKFEEDAKTNSILNGANVFKYDEVLRMYEPYDQILNNKDNLDKWIEKENKMLNPFGFNIEKV